LSNSREIPITQSREDFSAIAQAGFWNDSIRRIASLGRYGAKAEATSLLKYPGAMRLT
jgi:hypothetical protein